MKKLLIIVLFIGALFAKSNLENNASQIMHYSPFLWKATRGNSTIYLFGTMHIPHPYLTISSKLKTVMKNSDVIKTEIKMDDSLKIKVMQAMKRNDGKTLQDVLPKETFKRLDVQLKKISPFLSAKRLNNFKIWAISSTLGALKYQLKYHNYKPLDKQIYEWARDNNKSAGGVESIDEQLSVFEDFNQQEQIDMLNAALDDLEKRPNETERLLHNYITGNGEAIIKNFKDSLATAKISEDLKKRFIEKILYSRNVRMADRIDKLVSKNPNKKYLFAFGAMHFLGQKSVLYYLEKKGFNIQRLK